MSTSELHLKTDAVHLPDFTMDYFTFGTGPKPLVIIPGMSVRSILLSAEAVANGYAAYADEFTVYVLDYRRDLPPGFTVREMARDAAAALRQLGVRDAAVMGTSLGGMIAQYLAIDAPELVGRLALGATLPRHTKRSRQVFVEWAYLARAGERHALQRDIARRVYSPDFVKKFQAAFDLQEGGFTPEDMERYARLSEACMGFSSYDELGRVACPVLVIGSWRDRTLFPEGSLTLAKRLRCDLHMYAGYSHAVYDEAPDYRQRVIGFFLN